MDLAGQAVAYEFSGFRLDLGRRRLISPQGQPIDISSRVFDALRYMAERPGELLDKGTLMLAVWPDTVVEENNLNQVISALRRALGETPGAHRFVLTEPGRGYRFVAEVRAAGPSSQPSSLQSVAVLPFADMSPNQDQEYFADGIAEELLNQLSRLRGLHVAGRTSSFSFRNKAEDLRVIGEKLGVAHILEGSVRKAGTRVRINVQLAKAADGFHVWSRSFDREQNDIFAIQEEIAEAVADALSISLGVREAGFEAANTRNFEAYDSLLAARSLLFQQGTENYRRALELLEAAVRLDPAYVQAWSLLAIAYGSAGAVFMSDRAGELFEKSRQAAVRAAEIAPEAISSLLANSLQLRRQGNWLEAERNLKKALALAPADFLTNVMYGFFLLQVGRPGEAIDHYRRAVRIDPLALTPSLLLGLAHQMHGDVDAALAEFERAKSLIGNHVILNGSILVLALENDDRFLIEKYSDIIGEDETTLLEIRSFTRSALAMLDSPQAARPWLRRTCQKPGFSTPLSRGVISIYACYFGDPEFALQIASELAEQRVFPWEGVWRDIYKGMRRLPGFKDIVRRNGLVEYWQKSGRWPECCHPVGTGDFEFD